jgi:hypothetical protein
MVEKKKDRSAELDAALNRGTYELLEADEQDVLLPCLSPHPKA